MAHQVTRLAGLLPVVITYHGSDLLAENASGIVRKLISNYGVLCSRRASIKASGVVVVARHLIKSLPKDIDVQKVRVIPSGIDLGRFVPLDQKACRDRLGWKSDCFHVLFATNNGDPVKRPWLAQAAVEQLKAKGIRTEFHCLAGVSYSEVPIWINASDVFLLTSLHEGSPTIVKEALACRVPIVSMDVGDVAERIDGLENCHLADSDPVDIAKKLYMVFTKAQRLNCEDAVAGLSHIAIARKLRQFYHEMLNRPTGATEAPARASHLSTSNGIQ